VTEPRGREPGVKIVLFDLGNVVARWDPAPRIAAFVRRSGLASGEVRARLERDGFWSGTDRGECTLEAMEQGIRTRLGCEFTREELLQMQASVFCVQPVLIDDTPGHVRAAAACGWRAIAYESPLQLEHELCARGLLGAPRTGS
jgi:FMN phosphatase YigB (HAD superfamily)